MGLASEGLRSGGVGVRCGQSIWRCCLAPNGMLEDGKHKHMARRLFALVVQSFETPVDGVTRIGNQAKRNDRYQGSHWGHSTRTRYK